MATSSEKTRHQQTPPTVAVVGAGLVGCLQACFLARRGARVLLFERRPDIRRMEHVPGRSINMALSHRGRAALAAVGLEAAVLAEAIPMHSRMIHDLDGRQRPIRYGTREDQYLLSIDRRRLNEILLAAAESLDAVTVLYEHRVAKIDLEAGLLRFRVGGRGADGDGSTAAAAEAGTVAYSVDAIFGCDGAYSVVRQEMQAKTRLNFSQEYITHGYAEVPMPARLAANGEPEFPMEANYLHIWARNEFMMIGLPNADRSFTGTLFMPFDMFGELDGGESAARRFFARHFPDALPVIGEENLARAFSGGARAQPLITVRCEPFHHGGRAVLLGDAAHAMVPFYGQGMNAGFEDCLVLDALLERHGLDFAAAFAAFSAERCIDAHAICDLAMANYVEMRAHVNSYAFLARKKLDNALHRLLGDAWLPLYTSVSFTRTRYHQCVANRAWQDRLIDRTLRVAFVSALAVAAAGALWKSGTLVRGGNVVGGLCDRLSSLAEQAHAAAAGLFSRKL